MNKDIENIIKKNLPEKKGEVSWLNEDATGGYNIALDEINTSIIADEVLKVVGEKIKEEVEKYEPAYESEDKAIVSFGKQLLSNLSPKENKNNE